MSNLNSFIGLFLALMLVVACGERQDQQDRYGDDAPPMGDQQTQTQPGDPQTQPGDQQTQTMPPAGAEQDQTATEGQDVPQQEFVQQMELRLDRAEEELDEVRQNGEGLGVDEDQGHQERYEQIEQRIDNTRDRLSDLEDTGTENWEQLSQEVMNSVNDIEEDIQTLRGGGGVGGGDIGA